ncbi:MAG: PTS sugar transporter subunit IIB [Erysipelothrix sp.]|nr:PTS sugar transporter subunit IIB [Erysipelothrix sp.]
MVNVLLVCSGGMSTSILVKRMEKAAEDRGVEAKIWSEGTGVSDDIVKTADVVLLAPQIRFLLSEMKKKLEGKIPVELIDMRVYGTMNGEKALDFALEVMEKFDSK